MLGADFHFGHAAFQEYIGQGSHKFFPQDLHTDQLDSTRCVVTESSLGRRARMEPSQRAQEEGTAQGQEQETFAKP